MLLSTPRSTLVRPLAAVPASLPAVPARTRPQAVPAVVPVAAHGSVADRARIRQRLLAFGSW
jgi:hypothetical protein